MKGKMHEPRSEQVLGSGRISRTYVDSPATSRRRNWHNADIICEVRKAGSSLAALSRATGLAPSTLANALHRPWPKGELIIASFIGVKPEDIWPERYRKQH